jgi:hypothetical protein
MSREFCAIAAAVVTEYQLGTHTKGEQKEERILGLGFVILLSEVHAEILRILVLAPRRACMPRS